jgi:hypothetical protein
MGEKKEIERERECVCVVGEVSSVNKLEKEYFFALETFYDRIN